MALKCESASPRLPTPWYRARTAIFGGENGDWQATVVRDREFALAELRVGLINVEETQTIAGVTPDDRVVAKPGNELSLGMWVTVVPSEK